MRKDKIIHGFDACKICPNRIKCETAEGLPKNLKCVKDWKYVDILAYGEEK